MATAEQPNPSPAAPNPKPPLPKDDLLAALEAQPADSTYEELLRELHTRWAIRRGIEDADAGRTKTHEEVKEIIESWFE